ncbi:MAG: hypothetical protein ACNA8W_23885 [Bradymonadaceae bacterium]
MSVLFIGALIVAALMGGLAWQGSLVRKSWEGVARKLGLSITPHTWGTQPSMNGTYKGVKVSVHCEKVRHGRHTTYLTTYCADLDYRVPPDLEIFHEGLLARLEVLATGEDIEVGYPELDRRFIIRGTSSAEAEEFLRRPGVALALIRLHKQERGTVLRRRNLTLEINHQEGRASRMEARIEALVTAAAVINHSVQAPAPKDEAAAW